ncbi:MAG: hypothetical protein WAX80_03735 [Minisyncoccia bacterium]
MDIQEQINKINERNIRVELDKAWEVSFTRRLFISIITYITASIWLWTINETNFLLKAIIPTAGYILSTLSTPKLKKIWMGGNK